MSAYEWVARVGGEGGPLLVCAEASFAAWGGAVLDDDYELDPACDYARAHAVLYPSDDDEFEAGLVRFGADQVGLVWEMDGPGGADVAVGGDGLLVVRSWVRNSDAPRRYAAGPAARERERPVAELELSGGQAAVVWAPVDAGEATRTDNRLNLEHMLGVGAVVPLAPGRYRASCGWLEGRRGRYAPAEEQHGPPVEGNDDDWSCRWLRLTQL
ncbi:hypothetical protein GCM10009827_085020 [Dactylosporangium maewongense]|uniref:Uncharacterized protein n=1 Tax=Dactylosporangium maewongense TaxID=634393 RepID=A0ABP4MWG7_9ACTN